MNQTPFQYDINQQADWAIERLEAKAKTVAKPDAKPERTASSFKSKKEMESAPLRWLGTMFWGTVRLVAVVFTIGVAIVVMGPPLLAFLAYGLANQAFAWFEK